MLFSHKALGIEIAPDSAMLVLIDGKPHAPRLEAYSAVSLPPDTLRFSLKEENVKNPPVFVSKLRDAYIKLLTGTSRISVSLPDTSGHVVLLGLETRFKAKEEGADMIRWKLKRNFPFDINELHLDYQVLQERETGEVSTLVSLISRRVINQYEELLAQAGLQPNRIDFSTFNICRFFSSRLEISENGLFIVRHRDSISILIFQNFVLDFYRSKELPGTPGVFNRIFSEINSSILAYKEKQPGFSFNEVFYVAPHEQAEALRSVFAEATGVEPVFLDPGRVISRKEGLNVDAKTLNSLSSAIGAGVRNL